MATPVVDLACCTPVVPDIQDFNTKAVLPMGLTIEHIQRAMRDFTDFLGVVDSELYRKGMERLEDILMSANFSSMVGEFVQAAIPKYCNTLVKNTYHNGHPDMLPAGKYPQNAAQHAGADGIEVKASRYDSGWQGHNAEDAWLLVFVFEAGRVSDERKGIKKAPFRFLGAYGAMLSKSDWSEQPRKPEGRRTPTASVLETGVNKMKSNWIYEAPKPPKGPRKKLAKSDLDLFSVNDKA